MKTKKCPYCNKTIPAGYTICSGCGKQIEDVFFKKSTNPTLIILLGFLIFATFIIIAIVSPKNTSRSYSPNKYDAYVIMKKFVEDELISPSTAEFESISSIGIKQEGNIWAFDGYVDSQNSFGAMLRTKFTIAIRYNPEINDWSQLNIIFNE